MLTTDNWQDYISKLQTPAYVYNMDILEYVIDQIKKSSRSKDNLKLYYAIKANSNIEILEYLYPFIDGVDVASIHEYEIVSELFKDKRISVTGPRLNAHEIEYIYDCNGIVDFNSISQLNNCKSFILNKNIGLRIKLPYTYNNQVMGSRFGTNLDDNKFNLLSELNVKLTRLHFHNGEKDQNFFKYLALQLNKLEENNILNEITEINLGGGLVNIISNNKMSWFLNELQIIEERYFPNQCVNFILEPGRGLVQLCGILITKVISADRDKHGNNVIVDTSAYNLHHWFKPKLLTHTSKNKNKIRTNIYGTTCYEGDYFSLNKEVSELKIDDKLLFYPVGAYSKSNHTNLHGFPFPKEYYYSTKESGGDVHGLDFKKVGKKNGQ